MKSLKEIWKKWDEKSLKIPPYKHYQCFAFATWIMFAIAVGKYCDGWAFWIIFTLAWINLVFDRLAVSSKTIHDLTEIKCEIVLSQVETFKLDDPELIKKIRDELDKIGAKPIPPPEEKPEE